MDALKSGPNWSHIAQHHPRIKGAPARVKAAVSVIVREHQDQVEFLMMQRAFHENDPWSGQMAFPGGKVEVSDQNPRAAAMRETAEEVGIELSRQDYVGQLNDLYGFKHEGIYVAHISSFVFRAPENCVIKPNYEVADTVWLPFSHLEDPLNFQILEQPRSGIPDMPAITINPVKQQVLWGLSLRIVLMMYDLLEQPLAALSPEIKAQFREIEAQEV